MSDSPRVSVVIPTRDRAALLRQTLLSVQTQTLRQWEAVVVDDRSQDQTRTIVTELAATDPRIRYISREGTTSGAQVCRNQGVRASRGQYVLLLDSDDLLASSCLQGRVAAMDLRPDLDCLVFRAEVFAARPGDLSMIWNIDDGTDDLDRFLSLDGPWTTSSPIWRRSALLRLGPMDERLMSMQDWAYHTLALIKGIRYERRPVRDWFYRRGAGGNNSLTRRIFSPDHLKSHEHLFETVTQALAQQRPGSPQLQCFPIGWRLWLAEAWTAHRGGLRKALELWKSGRTRGLINGRQHIEGVVYLVLRCTPLWHAYRRHYLYRRWPASVFLGRPAKLCNTPIEAAPGDYSPALAEAVTAAAVT